MIKFKKTYIIFICLFFFSTLSLADNKIAYIDIDLILSQSNPSKSLFTQLKKVEENNFKQLKNDEINLKDEENKILSSKNIVSNEEYKKNVNNFKKKVNNYNQIKDQNIENLKKIRNKEILRFFDLIKPIIEKIMDDNSIDILFEKKNIFIAKSNFDITQIVIDSINENIKEFKVLE